MTSVPPPPPDLPAGWSARVPGEGDVQQLAELVAAHRRWVRGSATVGVASVAASVTGTGSWTRRQLVAASPAGELGAWISVHDRAGGRTVVDLVVAPGCPDGDALAGSLL